MGKYCDICKKKENEVSPEGIRELRIKNYVNGKWYSGHKAELCSVCMENILCCQDKIPSDLSIPPSFNEG